MAVVDNQLSEHRVLMLAPTVRDAEVTRAFLSKAGIDCFSCDDLNQLTDEAGLGAGAILLTEEAVSAAGIEKLIQFLDSQPAWSDLPLVMLMRGGVQSTAAIRVVQSLRNVTVLERPSSSRSVVSTLQAAVRARRRQYHAREQFATILQGESQYSEVQAQLALTIEASELGTFHCTFPLSKIVWNDRCKAHFWLGPEAEIDFGLFYSILHPDDRERTREAIEQCVNKGVPYNVEYRTVSPRGEIRWIRATGQTFFDVSGRPIQFDGTTHDITQQRKISEERERLLASEQAARIELERAGRMKDEFLATLSHELRTPLNAILGWSQLIRRGGDDDELLTEGLDVIERNARVQVQLIEDLLDMSRIISGKVRLNVQAVEPAAIIDAAIATVTPAAEAKEIRLQKIVDSNASPISGDPGRLQQVVWNLLSNAIKFTPKRGKVQVLLQRVNSHLEISVVDSGKGIQPEFLPYVFERFRQADSSTTRAHGGLGLGLAIVKQLVELHGGTISAASAGIDQGSTFTVVLPILALHPTGPAVARVHPQGSLAARFDCQPTTLAGITALVVDDETDARNLVKRVLEDCGARVTLAASAVEALQLLPAVKPDVLVSDIGMPGTDGYELLRQIRALDAEHGGKVPAIALTAFARSEDRTRALLAGYLAHVSKPVEPGELVATIAAVGAHAVSR